MGLPQPADRMNDHGLAGMAATESQTRPLATSPAADAKGAALGAALGAGLAVGADLAVFGVADRGSPIRVVTGWAPDGADLRIAEVVATAAVAVLLGAVVLWLLEHRVANSLRLWTAIAAGVALASAVPLFRLDVDTGSKVALATMHLVTGVAAIAGQAIVHRNPSDAARHHQARQSST